MIYFIDILHYNEYSLFEIISNSAFYKGIYSTPEWGSYYNSKHVNPTIPIIMKSVNSHYSNDNKDSYNSQFFYIAKIRDLCDRHNIKLLLISMPVHNEYKKRIPNKYIDLSQKAINNLGSSAHFIDFFNLTLDGNNFADGDHLNNSGSEIITMKIDSLLGESFSR